MDPASFPLVVHDDERIVLRTALKTFRDDFGHEEHEVAAILDGLLARVPGDESTPLLLDAADMKVTWSALHALLNGTSHGQGIERGHIRALLIRMPEEREILAIDLDTELERRS